MSPLIKIMADFLRDNYPHRFSVDEGETELLIRVPSRLDEMQVVKVAHEQARNSSVSLVRLRSRACLARDYRAVTTALEENAETTWCGFALDDSTQPPILDVTYSMPAANFDWGELVLAIEKVASYASQIGRRTGDANLF